MYVKREIYLENEDSLLYNSLLTIIFLFISAIVFEINLITSLNIY